MECQINGMTTRAIGKDRFHLHWACDAGSRGARPLCKRRLQPLLSQCKRRLQPLPGWRTGESKAGAFAYTNHIFAVSAGRRLPIALQENFKPARVPAQPGPPKRKK